MRRRYVQFVYLASGIIGICIGLVTFLIAPPDLTSLDLNKETSVYYVGGEYSYFPFVLDSGGLGPAVTVEWEIQLNYPSRAPKNSTILVEATPKISSIDASALENMFGQEMPDENDTRSRVWSELEGGILNMQLNLPAAKISPENLSSFYEGQISAWSVYLPVAGVHQGVVIAKSNFEGLVDLKLKQHGNGTITIQVYEPLFSRRNILSFIGLLLGPLVSIPGIYAFIRERRKDKEIGRKDHPKNSENP